MVLREYNHIKLITENSPQRIETFFLTVVRFELMAYTLSHINGPFFVMGFFEIGSGKLFAQVGFEPRSS
jgi:hypothetical protein